MFCCFRGACRHVILCGMRSENSLRISPPLPNPEHLPLYQRGPGGFNDKPKETPNISPLYQRGAGGGFNDRPKKTPNISTFPKGQNISPFTKGGRGDLTKRAQSEQIPLNPPLVKGGLERNPPLVKGGLERKFPGFRSATTYPLCRP